MWLYNKSYLFDGTVYVERIYNTVAWRHQLITGGICNNSRIHLNSILWRAFGGCLLFSWPSWRTPLRWCRFHYYHSYCLNLISQQYPRHYLYILIHSLFVSQLNCYCTPWTPMKVYIAQINIKQRSKEHPIPTKTEEAPFQSLLTCELQWLRFLHFHKMLASKQGCYQLQFLKAFHLEATFHKVACLVICFILVS